MKVLDNKGTQTLANKINNTYVKKTDTISVSKGGTGSTNASGALKNLGALPLGHYVVAEVPQGNTVTDIVKYLQKTEGGRIGSLRIDGEKDIITQGWWNYIWMPHAYGGSTLDYSNFGTLVVFTMLGAPSAYILQTASNGVVNNLSAITLK